MVIELTRESLLILRVVLIIGAAKRRLSIGFTDRLLAGRYKLSLPSWGGRRDGIVPLELVRVERRAAVRKSPLVAIKVALQTLPFNGPLLLLLLQLRAPGLDRYSIPCYLVIRHFVWPPRHLRQLP